ncbi:hypothetical protein ACFLXP_05910 [Chloroflexota bacterium]
MDEVEVTKQVSPEMEQAAAQRAKDRANAARWNLDIAVLAFAILIIVIILLFQDIGIEIIALVAAFGLAMVWLAGWKQGKQMYPRLYDEELLKLEQELAWAVIKTAENKVAETIEEQVQKALRDRLR